MTYSDEYVDARGIRFHCLQWDGDRDRAYFILHANSHCAGVYVPLAGRLASDGSCVVAMDMRGHGRSDKPESGYDWQSLRDDAVEVIDALDLRHVVIIGHSRGGAVSLMTAAALPGRVDGVVVHEPTIPPRSPDGRYLARSAAEVAATIAHATARRTTFADRQEALAYFQTEASRKTWRPEYLAAYVEHGTLDLPGGGVEVACPPRVQERLFEAQTSIAGWDAVKRDDLPVIGSYGELTGRGAGPEPAILGDMFKLAQTVVIPGATHSGPQEFPEVFEGQIRGLASLVHRPARPRV